MSQPRLVTFHELKTALMPYCMGYKWAEDAIHDLWKMGAPVPQDPRLPERRILLPGQFRKWWDEVQARKGYGLTSDQMQDIIRLNLLRQYASTLRQR